MKSDYAALIRPTWKEERRGIGGKIDSWRRSLDGKIDGVRVELSNVKADLGELKGKIDLIAQGLHIEISGRGRT